MASRLECFKAALGGLTIACAGTFFSGGVASAQDLLVGKTYGEAAQAIQSWGGKVILSTVVGDQVDMKKCLVSAWRKDKKTGKFYLSLYCDEKVATAKDAGASAASPSGREEKAHDEKVAWLHENQDMCVKMKDQHPEWFTIHMEGCEAFSPPAK